MSSAGEAQIPVVAASEEEEEMKEPWKNRRDACRKGLSRKARRQLAKMRRQAKKSKKCSSGSDDEDDDRDDVAPIPGKADMCQRKMLRRLVKRTVRQQLRKRGMKMMTMPFGPPRKGRGRKCPWGPRACPPNQKSPPFGGYPQRQAPPYQPMSRNRNWCQWQQPNPPPAMPGWHWHW